MNIIGKKTLLRAMEPSDMALLKEMMNDPEIEASVGGWSFPVSTSEQMRWYDTAVSDRNNKRFIIETTDREENTTIGMIYVCDFDWKNRSVSTGIKLSSSAPRRCGYATDAVMALFDYIFAELQMHRIGLKILSENAASIALYEKCGAKKEGTLRDSVFKGGKYHSQLCYGVLEADYKKAKNKIYG